MTTITFEPVDLSNSERIAALGAEVAWHIMYSPDGIDDAAKCAKQCDALMDAYGASKDQKNKAIREGALWVVKHERA